MTKFRNFATIAIALCVIISACFVGIAVTDGNYFASDSDSDFNNELVALYSNYDGDYSDIDENDKFALKRIIIADYDGNTYNAADIAVDDCNNLAVLQYKTSDDAAHAYDEAVADGHTVGADSFGTVDAYDKGEMCPSGSQIIGTNQFINNYKMGYDDVVVAVIDTAVMLNHDALQGRFFNDGYDFSEDGNNSADYAGCIEGDYYSHGTFVCGIIANNTPDNVKLLPYKVVANGSNAPLTSAILAAINDAISRGVDVISCSVSSNENYDLFQLAVNNAVANNICLCASAGNNSRKVYACPAALKGTITVSALDSSGSGFAEYSNYGSSVDFAAPGTRITSSIPAQSGSGYATYSGTSFSTPYVSACCANIKSMKNDLTKKEVYDILCDFAIDLGDEGRDEYFGNGVPQLGNMVYTDGSDYSYSLPQGELDIHNSIDYTETSQPWSLFNNKLVRVNIDSDVNEIGSYAFYDMSNADFCINSSINAVGAYAFYNCSRLSGITFDKRVSSIAERAFGGIDDFVITGYSNSPAESYALSEGINFISLGCRHSYSFELIDPDENSEGCTIYTCTACGYSYVGEYIEPDTSGECGADIVWSYDIINGELTLSGSGAMYSYTNSDEIPWSYFLTKLKTVVIDNRITALSRYSFYNAYSLNELTMPCSIKAPVDETTWFNCTSIESIILTRGNGRMSNYGSTPQDGIYMLTPWYVSKETLQSLKLDTLVVSIGSCAFIGCDAISSILLKNCEKIGNYAFYDCISLTSFVNYALTTVLGDNCLYAYSDSEFMPNKQLILCYNDSTTKDYAILNNIKYSTFGCKHSRGTYISVPLPVCCYDTEIQYLCVDCDACILSEPSYKSNDGHYVKATVKTKKGIVVENADVYVDGVLSAVTNSYGRFVLENVKCGQEHLLEIKVRDTVMASLAFATDGSNRTANLDIMYGDFYKNDGYVNGKDFAYALKNGFDDTAMFDYGKIDSSSYSIDTPYRDQLLPSVSRLVVMDYYQPNIRFFRADFNVGMDYSLVSYGAVYGKNMDADFMTEENIGKKNSDGYVLKHTGVQEAKSDSFGMNYGSTAGDGWVSARFYFTYTNGVNTHTVWSDVITYDYATDTVITTVAGD